MSCNIWKSKKKHHQTISERNINFDFSIGTDISKKWGNKRKGKLKKYRKTIMLRKKEENNILRCNYGILIRMKTRRVKKETRTLMAPIDKRMTRLSLGIRSFSLVMSSRMKPTAPSVNRKLDAKPSIMYCPFIRHCMNATWMKKKRII